MTFILTAEVHVHQLTVKSIYTHTQSRCRQNNIIYIYIYILDVWLFYFIRKLCPVLFI